MSGVRCLARRLEFSTNGRTCVATAETLLNGNEGNRRVVKPFVLDARILLAFVFGSLGSLRLNRLARVNRCVETVGAVHRLLTRPREPGDQLRETAGGRTADGEKRAAAPRKAPGSHRHRHRHRHSGQVRKGRGTMRLRTRGKGRMLTHITENAAHHTARQRNVTDA